MPNVVINERGIAMATISVGRQCRRKTKTVSTARSPPRMSAKFVSATASRIGIETVHDPPPTEQLHVGREDLVDLVDAAVDLVGDRDRVRPRLLAHAEADRGLAEIAQDSFLVGHSVLDSGHVAEADERPVDFPKDEVGELIERFELGGRLHAVKEALALEISRPDLDVLATDRGEHVVRGQAASAELFAIEPDSDATLPAAENPHAPDPGDGRQHRLDRALHDLGPFDGRAPGLHGAHEHHPFGTQVRPGDVRRLDLRR